jgi:hypothetical protein
MLYIRYSFAHQIGHEVDVKFLAYV